MPFQRLMETSVVKVGWVLFVCFCFYFLLCVVYGYFVLEERSRISQERDTEVQGGGVDSEFFTTLPSRGLEWLSWMQHGSYFSCWQRGTGPSCCHCRKTMQHSCQVTARIKTLRASLRGQGRLSSDPDSITSFLFISTLNECNRDFVLKIHSVNRSVGVSGWSLEGLLHKICAKLGVSMQFGEERTLVSLEVWKDSVTFMFQGLPYS